jgi:hypothetical protein
MSLGVIVLLRDAGQGLADANAVQDPLAAGSEWDEKNGDQN